VLGGQSRPNPLPPSSLTSGGLLIITLTDGLSVLTDHGRAGERELSQAHPVTEWSAISEPPPEAHSNAPVLP
jgi:hypothetical protein